MEAVAYAASGVATSYPFLKQIRNCYDKVVKNYLQAMIFSCLFPKKKEFCLVNMMIPKKLKTGVV